PQVVVSVSIIDTSGPTPVITSVSGTFLAEGKTGGLDINHLTVADLEGSPTLPTLSANQAFQVSVVGTGHQFLIDINDGAVPVFNADGTLAPDADTDTGNAQPRDAFGNKLTYDDELLDAHYMAGDGRVNENIGLTAVHAIFHSEH